jgi:hypothetical protein
MKNNYNIMILLYLIVIIFLMIQLYELYGLNNIENFSNNKIYNSNIQSFIMSPYENDNNVQKYFGTFIINKMNKNIENANYIYETNSLHSNNWKRTKIPKLDKSKNVIINDIIYDKYKQLLAIGLYYENDNPIYSLYRQSKLEKSDKVSEVSFKSWELIGEDIKIRSLCYDNLSTKLLGISSFDGQIYEKKMYSKTFNEWVGPINNDLPMRKISYDKDNNMIGIGLFDNYIYTKKGVNWKLEYWDKKKINKTQVYDVMYDYDGCLIATSPIGIIKQIKPELSSEFIDITKYVKQSNENILFKYDILKSKIGYEFLDEIFDTDTELGKHLKNIYDIKKLTKDLCNNKKYLRKTKVNNSNTDELSYKNREINDLYKQIEEINNRLSK